MLRFGLVRHYFQLICVFVFLQPPNTAFYDRLLVDAIKIPFDHNEITSECGWQVKDIYALAVKCNIITAIAFHKSFFSYITTNVYLCLTVLCNWDAFKVKSFVNDNLCFLDLLAV